MDDLKEKTIADGLGKGDPAAWSSLYEAYARKVWRAVSRLIGEETGHVGDVVQETFIAAARSARTYNARRGSLWAWLSGIMRKQAALHYRRHSRRRELTKARLWWRCLDGRKARLLGTGHLSAVDALESQELALLVRHALLKLSAEYQVILLEKYVDGAAVSEIAGLLGSSHEAVRSKLARARKAFGRAFRLTIRITGEEGAS